MRMACEVSQVSGHTLALKSQSQAYIGWQGLAGFHLCSSTVSGAGCSSGSAAAGCWSSSA